MKPDVDKVLPLVIDKVFWIFPSEHVVKFSETKPPKDNSPLTPVVGLRAKRIKCDSLQVRGPPRSSSPIPVPPCRPEPAAFWWDRDRVLHPAHGSGGWGRTDCAQPRIFSRLGDCILSISALTRFDWNRMKTPKLFREWQVWSPFQPGYFFSVWKEA